MSNYALEVQNLTKIYKEGLRRNPVKAVDELSFTIDAGSVVGLIGPNGAGKSTTIYCILGLLLPDEGSIEIFDKSPRDRKSREHLGFQSEIFHTYDFLKPQAALRFYGRLSGMKEANLDQKIDYQLDRLGLGHALNQKVGSFSKGMKQRLGVAQALLSDPDLLILDEPFTGLDPQGRKQIADIIFEEKDKGRTVFFSSHILSDVERLCDRVIMIRKGQVVMSGGLEDITQTDGQWLISVKGWEEVTQEQKQALDITADESEFTTELACNASQKNDLLRTLLDLPVEIVGMRQQTQSLEELYMQLDEQGQ